MPGLRVLGYRPREGFGQSALMPFDELQARLAADRAAAAKRAVAEERQRIARELHDVVAHSVSVMTVQAGAVGRLYIEDQERERLALETIEATGREALTEMRRLRRPPPGAGHDTRVRAATTRCARSTCSSETVREAGLPVELAVEGEPAELPAGRRPGGLPRGSRRR